MARAPAVRPVVRIVTENYQVIESGLIALRNYADSVDPEIHVGYNVPYAIYVHEDLTMNHPHGGQAKFLEEPAKKLVNDMTEIVREQVYVLGKRFSTALLKAGRHLLDASQPLVPVDTGLLKASGYVERVR